MAPIATIAVNRYQPRRNFSPEALDELAESIRQYGILQPLTVRIIADGYELIAGERRLQAARKAGLASVPVIIRGCTDREMLVLALVENLQREDLNAMEAARSYQQLVSDFKLSQIEVAERVGKNRSTVSNTMRLLTLPAPVQQAVEDSTISEGHARALMSVEDPERQVELCATAIKRGLSVRELETIARRPLKPVLQKSADLSPEADPHLLQVRSELQTLLGTRVVFKAGSTANSGTIEIDYYSTDDLTRVLEMLQR